MVHGFKRFENTCETFIDRFNTPFVLHLLTSTVRSFHITTHERSEVLRFVQKRLHESQFFIVAQKRTHMQRNLQTNVVFGALLFGGPAESLGRSPYICSMTQLNLEKEEVDTLDHLLKSRARCFGSRGNVFDLSERIALNPNNRMNARSKSAEQSKAGMERNFT